MMFATFTWVIMKPTERKYQMSDKLYQPMYSWYGSPIHLPLSEEMAAAYNRRVAQFQEAQVAYRETHGKPWTPSEPLWIEKDAEAQDAFEKVGTLINLLVEMCGGSIAISEADMLNDEGFIRIN